MAELDARRAEVLGVAAKIIQRRVRTYYARKQFVALRESAVCIQAFLRGNLSYKLFEKMRREAAAIRIQKHARKHRARKKYNKLWVSVLALQMTLRTMAARKEYHIRRRNKAATLIQTQWRCHRASSYYKRLRKTSLVTQCRWRGRLVRRELRKLKMKPGGIIALLDEACMFPKSTPGTFASKLYQTFKNHKRILKPKLSQTDFIISHYAGEVLHQSDQFLDKNKDYMVPKHQDLVTSSKCTFVAGLFPPVVEETTKSSNKSSKFSSIGSRFKLQLQQLMEILSSTEPHYIRCIKPNNLLKPAIFVVLELITYHL